MKFMLILCLALYLLKPTLARTKSNIKTVSRRRNYIVRCCGGESCELKSSVSTGAITTSTGSSGLLNPTGSISNTITKTSPTSSTSLLLVTTNAETSSLNNVPQTTYIDTMSVSISGAGSGSSSVATSISTLSNTPDTSNIITTDTTKQNSDLVSSSSQISTTTATSTTTSTTTDASTITSTTTATSTTTSTTASIHTTTTAIPCECPKNCNCSLNLLELKAGINFSDFDGNAKFKCGIPTKNVNLNNSLEAIDTIRQDYFCCLSCVNFTEKVTSNRRKRGVDSTSNLHCVQELKNVYIDNSNNGSVRVNFDVAIESTDCEQLYGQNVTITVPKNQTKCHPSLYMYVNASKVSACLKVTEMTSCTEISLASQASSTSQSDTFCVSSQPAPCQPYEYKCFQNTSLKLSYQYNIDLTICELHDIGDGRLYHFLLDDLKKMSQGNGSKVCKSKCGMDLAIIKNPEQSYLLSEYIHNLLTIRNLWWASKSYNIVEFWIDLVSYDIGNTWKWSRNNITATFLRWSSGPSTPADPKICVMYPVWKNKSSQYHAKYYNDGLTCDYLMGTICSN